MTCLSPSYFFILRTNYNVYTTSVANTLQLGLDVNEHVLFIPAIKDPYRNAPKQPEPSLYTITSLVIE
jgi:hypothetical protein